MRICIGIPCFHGVDYQVLEDYMRFAYYLGRRYQEHDFFLAIKGKTEQYRARNAMVIEAMKVGADYLLMLDDDHIIDISYQIPVPSSRYEFLRTLLNHRAPIVGALYRHRGMPCGPVAMMREGDIAYRLLKENELAGGLQEVDVTGGGCMLIDMNVISKLPQPWFEPESDVYGRSTDVQICRKAQDAGFKVYLDSSIEIGHQRFEKEIITSRTKHRVLEDYKFRVDSNA